MYNICFQRANMSDYNEEITQEVVEIQEKLTKIQKLLVMRGAESDTESENEDDGWEDVYEYYVSVNILIGEHPELQKFKKTKYSYTSYFQTYGGGPEGGYFIQKEWNNEGACFATVYAVERTWGAIFKVTRLIKTTRIPDRNGYGVAHRHKTGSDWGLQINVNA